MTISQAKQKLIAWANSQVGYAEGENNYNRYAALAEMRKLYGFDVQSNPWCDVFVDAGFIINFSYDAACAMTYQYSGCGGAACAKSAEYYKAHSAFYNTPEVGDQVFFYVSGGINHTGIVTQVGMGAITTVEGNSSDKVSRRTYAIGSPQIAGFGRPNWNVVVNDSNIKVSAPKQETAKEKVNTCNVTASIPVLQYGSKGFYVKLLQMLLIEKGFSCGPCGADGDYGGGTKTAVMAFQKKNSLTQDGIVGAATWGKLLSI